MAELDKTDEEPCREPDSVKTHHRAALSVDQARPLIPDSQFQYGSSHRGHQRQISEVPFAAIPKHMRTTSIQEGFGHSRDLSTSSALQPISSPFIIPGTPDLESFPGFQPQDSGPSLSFQTPQPVQGIFAVPGQPATEQRVLSHNGTPLIFDQAAFAQFQGVLGGSMGGSPGPLVQMYSPNPKGVNTKFTGLTPLLNFSPYPDHTPELQGTPTAREIVEEPANKTEKHALSSPDVSTELQHSDLYSPNKKKRIANSPSERQELYNSDITEENALEVPGEEYSEEAINHAWTDQDIEEMIGLLEHAERYKWRYISEQFYNNNQKRIPGIACSKKYRDLFGVPESSSLLGSSLFYIAFRRGWLAIKDEVTAMENEVKDEPSE